MIPEEQIEFERPYALADVDDRDETLCHTCGPESYPWPAAQLVAIKHRAPRHNRGIWRIYCREHIPAAPATVDLGSPAPAGATRSTRATKAATAAPVERPELVCPDCWIVVPPSGVCGSCGERITA